MIKSITINPTDDLDCLRAKQLISNRTYEVIAARNDSYKGAICVLSDVRLAGGTEHKKILFFLSSQFLAKHVMMELSHFYEDYLFREVDIKITIEKEYRKD